MKHFNHKLLTLSLLLGSLLFSTNGFADVNSFIIKVKTNNYPTGVFDTAENAHRFIIPTTGSGYNYSVDCDSNGSYEATGQTGSYTCDYGTFGAYNQTITIDGDFPRIYVNNNDFIRLKLLSVEQWGNQQWASMSHAFHGVENLVVNAIDNPNLSITVDMEKMFYGASNFNSDISAWNTAVVTNMSQMFAYATAFNQDIGAWNTAEVQNMYGLFVFSQALIKI